MSILSMDVVKEIFSTLPAKDLLRFRCMSKLICSVIDSPEFINLHLRRGLTSEANHHLIIRGEDSDLPMETFMADLDSLDMPLVKVSPPLHNSVGLSAMIIGSCNGLLAMFKMNTAANGSPRTRDLAVWNPSTRKFRMLPEVEQLDDYRKHFLGFGYDASADDYKVVFWQFHGEISRGTLLVYSVRAGSWTKPVTKDIPECVRFDDTCGTFYKSSVHWLVSRKEDPHLWIISFDLEREEFQWMTRLPYPGRKGVPTISVFRGCLCVNYIFYEGAGRMVEVWMLKEHGLQNSLTKVLYADGSVYFPIGYSVSRGEFLVKWRTGLSWCDLANESYEEVELHEGAPKCFSASIRSFTARVFSRISDIWTCQWSGAGRFCVGGMRPLFGSFPARVTCGTRKRSM